MDPGTYRRRLDGSLLCIGALLTLQAGGQLLVSAVRHLLDKVQTLFNLEQHMNAQTQQNVPREPPDARASEPPARPTDADGSPAEGPRSALLFSLPCGEILGFRLAYQMSRRRSSPEGKTQSAVTRRVINVDVGLDFLPNWPTELNRETVSP